MLRFVGDVAKAAELKGEDVITMNISRPLDKRKREANNDPADTSGFKGESLSLTMPPRTSTHRPLGTLQG